MRELDKKEANRIHAQNMNLSMLKAAKDVLLNDLQLGFELANKGLINASFYFIETILLEMVYNRNLDDLLEKNNENWFQSSTFADALARLALTSFWFVSPAANLFAKIRESKG